MKSVASRFSKVAVCCLTTGLFLLVISGVVLAQLSTQDMLKGAVKEGAKDMLGINKPVEGRTDMVNGAKMMIDGRKALREELLKNGKLKEGEVLEGGEMMSDGRDMIQEGDKLIESKNPAEGKKKMMDGARMMIDAKKKMLDNLSKKGMIKKVSSTEGETMMNEGEKLLKKGEMAMLK